MTFATANRVIETLQTADIVDEITGGRRNRVFRYEPYFRLFTEPEVDREEAGPVQVTDDATSTVPDLL